jgi:methylthioribose-1-phosphate isomerase
LQWIGGVDGYLQLIDQTRLPGALQLVSCRSDEDVWQAIRQLQVRGAPAIGIAAAYGVLLGLQPLLANGSYAAADPREFFARVDRVGDFLATSRPTAVNLFWALRRMRDRAAELRREGVRPQQAAESLLAEAQAIEAEDRQMCRRIGQHGASLLRDGQGVLTHCNAGGLATADYGTALAMLFAAHEQGKRLRVYVDETRPLLQGARLTTWELMQRGIETVLICDSAAAHVMQQGLVQAVVTGADRIAASGDTANKIGTYALAQLAAAHGIPFYVAAPSTTFDLQIDSGDQIPIEQREADEVAAPLGCRAAPDGVKVYNPAFDVTPARLITAIVCEHGIIRPVQREHIVHMLCGPPVGSGR